VLAGAFSLLAGVGGVEAQATFCRRRHHARRPPLAKIRPGRPAPAMGPGTDEILSGKAELRGSGRPTTKSAALLLVSVNPPRPRMMAVVLLGLGAGPAPSKKVASP
jgi:hypothetical protein